MSLLSILTPVDRGIRRNFLPHLVFAVGASRRGVVPPDGQETMSLRRKRQKARAPKMAA
jgi:hypothetical protein